LEPCNLRIWGAKTLNRIVARRLLFRSKKLNLFSMVRARISVSTSEWMQEIKRRGQSPLSPENLIGDLAYDSDPLDEELRRDGIEMIAPHHANRSKPPTQDRRRLSRFMRRWLVERLFAWIRWQRRILVRWEYHAQNFLSFVQLACLVILFRRF
jgi:transposase